VYALGDERSPRAKIYEVKKNLLVFGWESCLEPRERFWGPKQELLFESLLSDIKCVYEDSCPED